MKKMKTVLITGSSGLVGSESVSFFSKISENVIGIDNNMRRHFFGAQGDTSWNKIRLENQFTNFKSRNIDIRNYSELKNVFNEFRNSIDLVIHAAAQPSHDWAAKDPITDFTVNANGTLNLLELTRRHSPGAVFIFLSTNKVYGDTPNKLPLVELEKRLEIDLNHDFYQNGIPENMNIDNSMHSLFGASKLSADILVQEYGKYFNLKTGIFRGGCLTGPNHSSAELHGFLSYLVNCGVKKKVYNVFGYNGKQVRDNIHSSDLVNMFYHYFKNPRKGEVYNVGGQRKNSCSILEAIKKINLFLDIKINFKINDNFRKGDHKWWITDMSKFKDHFPNWNQRYDLKSIIEDIYLKIERE